MKQLMVARQFPANHPRAGEPTQFVERIWESIKSFAAKDFDFVKLQCMTLPNNHYVFDFATDYHPKHHTIRKGKCWANGKERKTGDIVNLKVWSGKPYRSKTITITPPIELTVFDIEIRNCDCDYCLHDFETGAHYNVFIDNKYSFMIGSPSWEKLAENDGLSSQEMTNWFIPKPKKFTGFSGQILVWGDVSYNQTPVLPPDTDIIDLHKIE